MNLRRLPAPWAGTVTAGATSKPGVDDEERQAVRAEGLDRSRRPSSDRHHRSSTVGSLDFQRSSPCATTQALSALSSAASLVMPCFHPYKTAAISGFVRRVRCQRYRGQMSFSGLGITSSPTPKAGRSGACAASATARWSQGFDLGDTARRLFELSVRHEAAGRDREERCTGGVCSRSNFRAVLMSVDGINTFGVSAGHFASLGVRIAVQMPQTGKRQVGRRPVGSMASGAAKHDPLRVKS
jgi:hypothetical protein